jgi:hypothetical protein
MTRKNFKAALGNSLHAEEKRIQEKFAKAENVIKGVESFSNKGEEEQPEVTQHKTVIRDSFTLPENDYELIEQLRQRSLKNGINVTKSEVFRAGLHALTKMSDKEFIKIVEGLEKIKTGRPTSRKQYE